MWPDEGSDQAILVCDDDPSVRALYSMTLSVIGPRVLEAADGAEALRLSLDNELAVVVLDSRMPGMTGLEVLNRLRERPATSRVPVVFVTADRDPGERIKAFEAGAHDYLCKPVHLDELRARVRSQLQRHQEALGELGRLERLAQAATTLCRAQVHGSVELMAAATCRELGRLHGDLDLSIHAFVGDGVTDCLADHRHDGDTRPGGQPIPSERSRWVYLRSSLGPWMESSEPDILHAEAGCRVFPGERTTGWVPLTLEGEVLGVLTLGTGGSGEAAFERVAHGMGITVEFAPTIASLLAPGLEQRSALFQRRNRLSRITGGDFFTVFQPIFELTGGGIEGYEALSRFVDGTPPEAQLAEAASLGGLVALEMSLCRSALEGVAELPRAPWVSLNVSPAILLDGSLRDVLSHHQGPPVVLEITEQDRIDDYEAMRKAVREVGHEVRLCVDDAGAGYSCLRHILDLRPEFIKLDHSWVRGVDKDPARQALVGALSHFSKQTGTQIIAEGIETEEELNVLAALDVRLGQGFHLGAPAPVTAWGPVQELRPS
jgi:EAL domain-containing protein (putative c-di-GMP-specific phosphodiesterase class I)/DNA-binding response OmpR family regulator